MSEVVYIDGNFLAAHEAGVSVHDPGLNYGWGLFETMQSYGGNVFLFDEHLERLILGARALSIESSQLEKIARDNKDGKKAGPIGELLKKNSLTEKNAYIKMIATKGVETKEATIIIIARAIEEEKLTALRKQGVKAILADEPGRYKPDVKSLNYMPNILARIEAEKQAAYEAVFWASEDKILEGSATNIFIVKDARLITPELDGSILPGITRAKVIRLAKASGLAVTTAPVKRSELTGSDEAFLTNSIIEVMPLVEVDSSLIANGKPGELTCKLQRLYREAAYGK